MLVTLLSFVSSLLSFFTEMPFSEQLKVVNIDDIDQTEYKIVNLKPDTKYIVYLRAATVMDGERTFVEDSTNVLAGVLPVLSY